MIDREFGGRRLLVVTLLALGIGLPATAASKPGGGITAAGVGASTTGAATTGAAGATGVTARPTAQAQEVSFPTADGGTVFAHLYGSGTRGVLLAHGQVFNKESWRPLAEELAGAGHLVLAIDFRGYGSSVAGSEPRALYQDVLAGVRYLAGEHGAEVDVIGGSMGGGAAAEAAGMSEPGEIRRLILLSGVPISNPERMKAERILFIASEEEPMAPRVRDQYGRAPEPKRLEMLPGDAHAQHIFRSDQGEALSALILAFLSEPRSPAAR